MPKEILRDLVEVLSPPTDGQPTPEWRWRATVAISIVGGYGLALVQAALIWGFFNTIGFSGFARADDVKQRFADVGRNSAQVNSKLDELGRSQQVSVNQLTKIILSGNITTAYNSCIEAKRQGNAGLAQSIASQLSQLQSQYQAVNNGYVYPVGPCD